jgi:hypothetical protein
MADLARRFGKGWYGSGMTPRIDRCIDDGEIYRTVRPLYIVEIARSGRKLSVLNLKVVRGNH